MTDETLHKEVVERAADFLAFVTRYVWSKPDLSDKEIIAVLRQHPDVLELKNEWKIIAANFGDGHTFDKIQAVERSVA